LLGSGDSRRDDARRSEGFERLEEVPEACAVARGGVARELLFPAADNRADDERRDLRRREVTRFREERFRDDVARAV
jgi:hypothetical protein